jgi:L-rhamnose-H+ transport protein
MIPNPALGVFFHWLGGLASGSFYVPYRSVKGWSWETYWLVGGVFSWIVVPLVFGLAMTNNLFAVLLQTPGKTILWCYFFGVLWGVGGLTFGLTMRYLGMSLGMAVSLGYCAALGTLAPPIFRGEFAERVLGTRSGIVILVGMAVCLAGIVIAGMAGMSKERELAAEQRMAVIKEFNLRKGLIIATVCGVMSACFSYGLAAGEPLRAITLRHGTSSLWQGLPVLVVVLLGGFTTNVFWCLTLNARNNTRSEYFKSAVEIPRESGSMVPVGTERVPLWKNYALCASAGTIWYLQFFFYTMGETQMGIYRFSSWTLHMASIMIFGSLWGLALKEWQGSGRRTMRLLALSLTLLVASTVVVGYGNYLGRSAASAANPGSAPVKSSFRSDRHSFDHSAVDV